MAKRAPTARTLAADVILRVLRDGAFAAAALDAELGRAVQLEPRDRALATELVYGTLRLLPWIEERVGRHAVRGLGSIDEVVRAHLFVAAYQLLVLTRVPAFAAVNEAVTAVRTLRSDRLGGFVNAVLRKVAREPKPSAEELADAAFRSADPELTAALVRSVGEDAARALLVVSPDSDGHAVSAALRVEVASERDGWLSRLRAERPEASFDAGKVSAHAIVVRGAGRVADLPGYEEGALTPQEEGSQLVALSLGARPGERVLDACAGRGNKTALLARAVLPGGSVDATDLHPSKLERLALELDRIGLAVGRTVAVDWSRGPGSIEPVYDRILIDAPCSGTGTLRRRPELVLRRLATDLPELARLQRAILKQAAGRLKPGGRLVYAVCSVLREEGEDVVKEAADLGLVPTPFEGSAARALAGESSTLRLLPHLHETDGYFIASFQRS